jgi:hypothetical protein
MLRTWDLTSKTYNNLVCLNILLSPYPPQCLISALTSLILLKHISHVIVKHCYNLARQCHEYNIDYCRGELAWKNTLVHDRLWDLCSWVLVSSLFCSMLGSLSLFIACWLSKTREGRTYQVSLLSHSCICDVPLR